MSSDWKMIMAAKPTKKELLRSAMKWAINTTVDADKIAAHFGLNKAKFRKLAAKIREERDKVWFPQQLSPESQDKMEAT